MRVTFIILLLTSIFSCRQSPVADHITFADNNVVAHRGAWKTKAFPENSIAALRYAIEIGCNGTEIDVRMTADSVLIVTHDKDYNGLLIEETTYDSLAQVPLPNGEILPTLENVILAAMENNHTTGIVCEIKPSSTKERGEKVAVKVVEIVRRLDAEKYMSSYISFGYGILQKIHEIEPNAHTQYLNGKKSPRELANDGISGLDYYMNEYRKNPQWIQEAKDLGLTLNVWTVNKSEDLDLFIDYGFDYITTNEPEILLEKNKVLTNMN